MHSINGKARKEGKEITINKCPARPVIPLHCTSLWIHNTQQAHKTLVIKLASSRPEDMRGRAGWQWVVVKLKENCLLFLFNNYININYIYNHVHISVNIFPLCMWCGLCCVVCTNWFVLWSPHATPSTYCTTLVHTFDCGGAHTTLVVHSYIHTIILSWYTRRDKLKIHYMAKTNHALQLKIFSFLFAMKWYAGNLFSFGCTWVYPWPRSIHQTSSFI